MQLIHVAQRPVSPWRNGGGQTRVMAQGPSATSPDDFSWRLSVAQVDRSGPFSAYPGLHRQLIVAGDQPLTLVIDDHRRTLGPGSIAAFDGGASVSCEVARGPVTAVNVMTRPGQVTAQVTIEDAEADLVVESPTAGWSCLVALTQHTTLGGHSLAMAPQDTLWLQEGERETVSGGRIVVIRFSNLT